MTDSSVIDRIEAMLAADDVVLFMKGTPDAPQCGFSAAVVQALKGLGVPFKGVDILADAALRAGIKKVMIPEENAKDLAEIPDNVKSGMEIVPVARMDDVLKHALVRMPEPIIWDEEAEEAAAAARAAAEKTGEGARAH